MVGLSITQLAIPVLCLPNMRGRDEKVWTAGFMIMGGYKSSRTYKYVDKNTMINTLTDCVLWQAVCQTHCVLDTNII